MFMFREAQKMANGTQIVPKIYGSVLANIIITKFYLQGAEYMPLIKVTRSMGR